MGLVPRGVNSRQDGRERQILKQSQHLELLFRTIQQIKRKVDLPPSCVTPTLVDVPTPYCTTVSQKADTHIINSQEKRQEVISKAKTVVVGGS